MLEGWHFQNAYVTRDSERAIDVLQSQMGVSLDVARIELEQEIWTPHASGVARQKIAYFWVDDLQYEIIEPVDGNVTPYVNGLPEAGVMKFHHAGFRIAEWEPFRKRVARSGQAVAIEGQSGSDLRFLYLDTSKLFGHYLEYVWCTPAMWDVISAGQT